MKFELKILGCNGAMPAFGRYPTSQVLNVQDDFFMIDCGEGAQMRMADFQVKRGKINHIFISHLHGDHFYGLIGLITSYALLGRTTPLTVFSPNGLEEMMDVLLLGKKDALSYPLIFKAIDTTIHSLIFENDIVSVYSIPLQHRIPTSGYLFREKKRPNHILPDKLVEYNIPQAAINLIKLGADFTLPDGKVIPNQELTSPAAKPRSFAFCSDTVYDESIIPFIEGVDMLYHETTFCNDVAHLAAERMHSTAEQAATIAKKAKVGQLITGHYSSRYADLQPLLAEAKNIFPNSVLGLEGNIYGIPFAKRK